MLPDDHALHAVMFQALRSALDLSESEANMRLLRAYADVPSTEPAPQSMSAITSCKPTHPTESYRKPKPATASVPFHRLFPLALSWSSMLRTQRPGRSAAECFSFMTVMPLRGGSSGTQVFIQSRLPRLLPSCMRKQEKPSGNEPIGWAATESWMTCTSGLSPCRSTKKKRRYEKHES